MIKSKESLLNQITKLNPWYVVAIPKGYYVVQHNNDNGPGKLIQITKALYDELLPLCYIITMTYRLGYGNLVKAIQDSKKEAPTS